ncbi:MAG TPA: tRNA preQ1(34) S-adenosylmethionine ribosyltransferase-isomerase QueA [Candidatus Acidoferrum sp.]|nr:tRNA preQ1(34) S-adenosylmethionine ribosyltransferase-isomerase QueA [Candidatus Acidoferrum sp.]
MNVSDFDYELPSSCIAQRPLPERDGSRMLLVDRRTGAWNDRLFGEFPNLLRGDEVVVLNNAKVIPARLFGRRGGIHARAPGRHNPAPGEFLKRQIEVLLVRRIDVDCWEALVRPGRKIPTGECIVFGQGELVARVEGRAAFGLRTVRFEPPNAIEKTLESLGHIPLPPYIKRHDEPADRERYQTVYAHAGTAVAAPTAGLHFTPQILKRIRARGAEIIEITLDVGLGTFEPVRTENLEEHKIHAESYEIGESAAAALNHARRERRPILAVGTTVVRALEDVARKSPAKSGGEQFQMEPGLRTADIFLYPGKPFRVVNQLLTNFHLPRSTLLAMVAAFAGRENILAAYRHAVEAGYRFYSYGDCMLIR